MEERRIKLAQFGQRLGTRQEGRRAHDVLLRALAALPPGGRLVVDLSGMEVLSGSFADEALASLLSELRDGELPDRYLLIRADDEELLEDLSERLSRRGLALLALVRDGYRVLGKLPPYLAEALEQVIEQGRLTSLELARLLGISVQNASVRLRELAKLRLIRMVQESRPVGGVQYRAVSLTSLKRHP